MPIRPLSPPTASVEAVLEGVSKLAESPRGGGDRLHLLMESEEVTTLTAPHPSYVLRLDELTPVEDALDSARLTGWRYLVLQGSEYVGVGETSERADTSKFSKLGSRDRARVIASALRLAEQVASNRADEMEIRYLRVPSLHTSMVWLHGEHADVVLPIETQARSDLSYPPTDAVVYLAALALRSASGRSQDGGAIGG